MKKVNYLFVAVISTALIFTSCKKKTEDTPAKEETAPTSYSKKIVLEYFSGTWCGWCPDGVTYAKNLLNAYPGKSVYIVAHNSGNDPMQTPETKALADMYNAGYPTGMVNRVLSSTGKAQSRTTWNATASTELSVAANAGLAIDASNSSSVKIKVGVGTTDLKTGTKLHVYGVAKSVTRDMGPWGTSYWDQTNYLYMTNGFQSSPFYTKGDYYLTASNGSKIYFIKNYNHEHVLADIMTTNFNGEVLTGDALKSGKVSTFTFALDKGQYANEEFQIVAFLSDPTTGKVINAQYIDLGKTINFD